jgi:rubrerythrin
MGGDMNKAYILTELIRIGIRSDGVKIKRCILCSTETKKPDDDCPVCRVIKHLKAPKK